MISGHIHTKALIGFPKPIDNWKIMYYNII
jgi:hypothetical protein